MAPRHRIIATMMMDKDFKNPLTNSIVAFVRNVGLPVVRGELDDGAFMPGLALDGGPGMKAPSSSSPRTTGKPTLRTKATMLFVRGFLKSLSIIIVAMIRCRGAIPSKNPFSALSIVAVDGPVACHRDDVDRRNAAAGPL